MYKVEELNVYLGELIAPLNAVLSYIVIYRSPHLRYVCILALLGIILKVP